MCRRQLNFYGLQYCRCKVIFHFLADFISFLNCFIFRRRTLTVFSVSRISLELSNSVIFLKIWISHKKDGFTTTTTVMEEIRKRWRVWKDIFLNFDNLAFEKRKYSIDAILNRNFGQFWQPCIWKKNSHDVIMHMESFYKEKNSSCDFNHHCQSKELSSDDTVLKYFRKYEDQKNSKFYISFVARNVRIPSK